MLLSLLPDGYDRWFDLTPPDPRVPSSTGSDAWRILDGAAEQLALRAVSPAEKAQLDANPLTATAVGVAAWEWALGLTLTAAGKTLAQRQARVVARLREYGAPTLANIQAALAAILGYVPPILETSRGALMVINTQAVPGLPITVPARGVGLVNFNLVDNAPASMAGARLWVTITHPHVEELTVSLISPGSAASAQWEVPGSGAVVSHGYIFESPAFGGHAIEGSWQLQVRDTGGASPGTALVASILVEGIGRDPSTGADGLGAAIFDWSVLVDESLVNLATYDRTTAREVVARWNPAFARGQLVVVNSLGTNYCIFDDPRTAFDGGLFAP